MNDNGPNEKEGLSNIFPETIGLEIQLTDSSSLFEDPLYAIGHWYPSPNHIAQSNDLDFLSDCLTFTPDPSRIDLVPTDQIQSVTGDIRQEAFERLSVLAQIGFAAEIDNAQSLVDSSICNQQSSLGREALDVLIETIPAKGFVSQKSDLCRLLAGHVEYADTLISLISDPHMNVRQTAGFVLGKMSSHPEVETKILATSEELDLSRSYEITEPLCYALREARSPQALLLIEKIKEVSEPGTAPFIAATIISANNTGGSRAA